jgi:hypothetical protein
VVPEQIVIALFETLGFGLTETIIVKVEPAHAPDKGVTIYVKFCSSRSDQWNSELSILQIDPLG